MMQWHVNMSKRTCRNVPHSEFETPMTNFTALETRGAISRAIVLTIIAPSIVNYRLSNAHNRRYRVPIVVTIYLSHINPLHADRRRLRTSLARRPRLDMKMGSATMATSGERERLMNRTSITRYWSLVLTYQLSRTSETSPLLGFASAKRRRHLNLRNTLAFVAILGILSLTVFNLVHLVSYSSLQSSIAASRRQLGDIRTEVASVELRRVEETSAFKVEQAERSNHREKETQQWDAERHERKDQMEKENEEWTATRRQRQEQNEREDQQRALDHQRENERWEENRRHRQAQRQQETEEWEQERQRRAEEEERDEASKRDAEKRAEMHLWWDSPQYAPHCAAWGTREYTAKLHNVADGYDPIRACEHTPVVVHENVVNKPDWCESRVRICSSSLERQ
jgi:hypothetical protein